MKTKTKHFGIGYQAKFHCYYIYGDVGLGTQTFNVSFNVYRSYEKLRVTKYTVFISSLNALTPWSR